MTAKNLRDPIVNNKLRKEHNQDLIRRMRNGESLTSFDSQSSWFPPRPVISKDPDAIAQLYGNKARPIFKDDNDDAEERTQSQSEVIRLVR